MAVTAGLPERNGDRHSGEICGMSLALLDTVRRHRVTHTRLNILSPVLMVWRLVLMSGV